MREPGPEQPEDHAADTGEMVITDIRPQRKRGRVSVFINHEFMMGAEEASIALLGWTVGQALTERAFRRAQEELEYRAARASAESYLGYQPRSEQELVRKLEQKGYSPGAVQNVLRYAREQGYINDKVYAARYTEVASRRRLGRRRVAADLRQRGIDSEVAQEAVNTLSDETEKVLALEFATRRAVGMARLDDAVRHRRLAAALQRRGFSHSTIKAVLEQVLQGEDAE